MEQKKLFNYLSRLKKGEWKAFEAFLRNPMLGASDLYCDFLAGFYEMKFRNQPMTEEDFHAKVYGNRDYRESHMNRHYSQMLDKLFDFLAYEVYCQDEGLRLEARVKALATRGWVEACEEDYKKTVRKFQQNPMRPVADYLGLAKASILKTSLQPRPAPRDQQHFFQHAIDMLDLGYAISALELATKASNYDLQQTIHHQVPRWLAEVGQTSSPTPVGRQAMEVLQEVYHLYNTPTSEAAAHFMAAQELLVASLVHLNSSNKLLFQELFNHLVSHGGRNLQANPELYRPALSALYDTMLKHGLLLIGGELSPLHFLNIVNRVWRTESLQDAMKHIAAHQDKLPVNLRDATRDTASAIVHFQHGQFHEAHQMLKNAIVTMGIAESLELSLSIKTHLLILTIECGDCEAVEDMAQSFRAWLNRHNASMPTQRLASYLGFIDAASKIALRHLQRQSYGSQGDWLADLEVLEKKWSMRQPVHFAWIRRQIATL